MQRTVKSTKVKLLARGYNGEIERDLFNETDEKKIVKKLEKEFDRGSFMITKMTTVEDLYILDDDFFFKYAKKADSTEPTENTEAAEG